MGSSRKNTQKKTVYDFVGKIKQGMDSSLCGRIFGPFLHYMEWTVTSYEKASSYHRNCCVCVCVWLVLHATYTLRVLQLILIN